MAEKSKKTSKMSEALAEMKFMQRAPSKGGEKSSLVPKKIRKILKGVQFESSYAVVENLIFGRFSYQGFNKDVEKLMVAHSKADDLSEGELSDEVEVGYQEVAKQFSLVNTVGQKFNRKRKVKDIIDTFDEEQEVTKKEKTTFMKPKD